MFSDAKIVLRVRTAYHLLFGRIPPSQCSQHLKRCEQRLRCVPPLSKRHLCFFSIYAEMNLSA